jgi:uncharacterized protein YjbI with pentapeptide repeats
MLKTNFKSCSLKEVSFANSVLTASLFDNCNMENAVFSETNLEKVDFSTAYNYKIDPEYNIMKKAKFSTAGIMGLLDKYDIVVT